VDFLYSTTVHALAVHLALEDLERLASVGAAHVALACAERRSAMDALADDLERRVQVRLRFSGLDLVDQAPLAHVLRRVRPLHRVPVRLARLAELALNLVRVKLVRRAELPNTVEQGALALSDHGATVMVMKTVHGPQSPQPVPCGIR
jgi:hypothetical protein